mmetsp:Transcript_18641/g.25963  ORF Transcript_18641/g.25963 Transcript_18641/m.25963 type:complete len:98 (-) Transcript_18641:714-1007(-)
MLPVERLSELSRQVVARIGVNPGRNRHWIFVGSFESHLLRKRTSQVLEYLENNLFASFVTLEIILFATLRLLDAFPIMDFYRSKVSDTIIILHPILV